jgi:hypothetical protein
VIRLVSQLFLTALVVGLAAATSAAGRVTWPLLASTTLCWAFVPVLQGITASVVLLSAPRRPPLVQGLTGWFALQRPWSLYLLAAAAVIMFFPRIPMEFVLAGALIAGVLTSRALIRFAVTHLGDTRRAAVRRVAMHQAVTFAVIFMYFATAVSLTPRILAWLK